MSEYKKHYLAGYIGDLWFIVRKLRDLKSDLVDFGISTHNLTAAQSRISKTIPKLEHKLKEMEAKAKKGGELEV